MRLTSLILVLCAGLLAFFPAPAHALGIILPGSYQLLDHGDGALGPDYGLRVDGISEVFSVELGGASVVLDWAGGASATIIGTVRNNATLQLWDVSYTLTGVVAAAGNSGFTATAGTGTLTDPFNVVTILIGEQNGAGLVFVFLADGHRIAGDDDSAVGRGWLLPPATTDDWLVRAQQVPEPAILLLVGSALAGLAIRRRI